MRKIFIAIIFLLSISYIIEAQNLARRAFVGIRIKPIDTEIQSKYSLETQEGVWIEGFVAKSSAEEAGLKKKDVILEVNQEKVKDVPQFIAIIKKFEVGQKVSLLVWRDKKKKKIKLKVKELPREESPYRDTFYESISFEKNISRVIITKPKKQKVKYPAVLLIQGINCGSVDYPFGKGALLPFVDSLTDKGFVTIRVEKTGIGDSKGQPCLESNFDTELNTFREGLKYLKQLDYVDTESIYLFGWSMGGVIAPVIASENPVKGIMVFGTVCRNWLEYEIENTRRQTELTSDDYAETDRRMRLKERALHYLLVEKMTPEEIIAKNKELEAFVSFYPRHYTYIQQLAELNLAEYWTKIDAKVLAIHGEADFVSSAKDHADIAKIVGNKATYLEMSDIDHFMIKASTEKESIAMNLTEKNYKLVQVFCDWIQDKNIDAYTQK